MLAYTLDALMEATGLICARVNRTNVTRVMIIDDHPAVRDALMATINTKLDMVVCGEASSAEEALLRLGSLEPDVVILDVSLEDVHGLDLVQEIHALRPETRIIIFSMYDEKVYAERAIRIGALGYLMKSEPTQHVIDAIRNVSQGEMYLSRSMAQRILNASSRRQTGALGFAIDDLTNREKVVFELLGQGHSIEKIAELLKVEIKTAETYRRRAKEKLGLETVNELLQYAVRWTQS